LLSPCAVRVIDLHPTRVEECLAAAGGWDVRYFQLGPGRGRGRHLLIHTKRLQLVFESWPVGMLKRGRGPAGFVTFLVPVAGATARIHGRRVRAGDVVVLRESDAFDYRSQGAAQLLSVSLERRALEAHARALLGRHLGELRLQGHLRGLRTNPLLLRSLCLGLAARAAAEPRLVRHPGVTRGLETTLVKALLSGPGTPQEAAPPCPGRRLALRAEAWLRQNLADPPSIARLCGALGAGERTIHEAFRAHLDASPMAYLKALRLNAARQALLEARGRRRVTDVALDWGFLHFGWFSQDYRRLFGETPNQTRMRGRAEPPRARFEAALPLVRARRYA
jgi:AraC family ethanolamine operon transcriptional activator